MLCEDIVSVTFCQIPRPSNFRNFANMKTVFRFNPNLQAMKASNLRTFPLGLCTMRVVFKIN
jgi:hypothetical protein